MTRRLLTTQKIVNLSTDPASGVSGEVYFNTTSNTLKVYDGTSWTPVGSGGGGSILPTQTGNTGKYLNTNGTSASWSSIAESDVTGLTTSLSGKQPLDADLTAISALAGTSGLLKKTAADTWILDTNAYSTTTGTVTSVGISVPTGLSVSNTPVTSSGTIALALTAGYSIPTTSSQSNWDTAYTDRNKWDGDATGLVAATGRTSLGLGTMATAATADYAALAGATFTGAVVLAADPSTNLGAATKQYVDAVAQGLHIHASAATATTTNIANLSSPGASIDGVTLTTNMRVLVKNQTTTSQNGIYVFNGSALVRASDFDSAAEIDGGDFVFVTGGSINNDTGWVQTETVVTVGTDPIIFTQFSGAGTYTAGTGLSLTGTVFANTGVLSVNGSTGAVTGIATLASPELTGTPASTTAAADTNTTQIATTAFVVGQGYAKLASPTFTGTVTSGLLVRQQGANTNTSTYYSGVSLMLQNTSATAGNFAGIGFNSAGGSDVAAIHAIFTSHGAGTSSGHLVFSTSNGAPAPTERLRIDSAGISTFAGSIVAVASTTSVPSIRMPHGTAPTAPTNGDVWTTTAGIYVRINGTTVGPLGSGGSSGATVSDTPPSSPSSGQMWFESDTGKTFVYYGSAWVEIGDSSSSGNVSTNVSLSNSWWLGV